MLFSICSPTIWFSRVTSEIGNNIQSVAQTRKQIFIIHFRSLPILFTFNLSPKPNVVNFQSATLLSSPMATCSLDHCQRRPRSLCHPACNHSNRSKVKWSFLFTSTVPTILKITLLPRPLRWRPFITGFLLSPAFQTPDGPNSSQFPKLTGFLDFPP